MHDVVLKLKNTLQKLVKMAVVVYDYETKE